MKDKIKGSLCIALSAVNTPFFLARMLIMFIPIVVGCVLADYTSDDDCYRFVASMLWAVYISGPIGIVVRTVILKVVGCTDEDVRDYVIERLRQKRSE